MLLRHRLPNRTSNQPRRTNQTIETTVEGVERAERHVIRRLRGQGVMSYVATWAGRANECHTSPTWAGRANEREGYILMPKADAVGISMRGAWYLSGARRLGLKARVQRGSGRRVLLL